VKSGRRAARDEWQKGNVGEEDGWQAIDENEDEDGRNKEGQKAVSMEWESREEGWEARCEMGGGRGGQAARNGRWQVAGRGRQQGARM